jgi:hypothetical protein
MMRPRTESLGIGRRAADGRVIAADPGGKGTFAGDLL